MDKLKMHSPDLAQRNIEAIAELFPTVVTETLDVDGNPVRAIDFDGLRQELSDHIVEGPNERYQLDWPGKRAAAFAANAPIAKTLRPQRAESVDFDTTKNLFIEGDNLDALKLLQESYLGKVKLIYIDPPYNTGSDFIYEDDFAESSAGYLQRSGQVGIDGSRFVSNSESNGRFHSDWLSMMYSRLKLARSLLSEDGAIFVNIDFNEAHNLKRLMDEVFGESNFQREIIWRIGWLSGYKTLANNFIRNHDTILFYSRNADSLDFRKQYIENADFKPVLKPDKNLTDKLGQLGLSGEAQKELLDFVNHGNRPDRYPIEDTWNSNEYDDLNSIAIVSFSGEKVSKLVGVGEDFKGQKSVRMLQRILEATTRGDDIVVDFFAGTASTAHAVMQLNARDGGRRRFVMVQLPEVVERDSAAYEAGYKTIGDLARARIRVVGEKLQSDLLGAQVDVGFRSLVVDTTNVADVLRTPDETDQQTLGFAEDSIKPDRSDDDLIFQVLLDWGLDLTEPIVVEEIANRSVLTVADGALIACFAAELTDDVVKGIAERHPLRAVFKDSGFSDDAARINASQIFREVSPETDVRAI
ncbi:site-specific DNA-methyltransferase [Agromyces sp. GXS1127]|uniref:site-specific DNA-methyltransferase n=1 Tax=Agromyces sp. GXS1127 TaxID=3424181 RepID=UPI003D31A772